MHVTQLYFKKQGSQKGRNKISGSWKYSHRVWLHTIDN